MNRKGEGVEGGQNNAKPIYINNWNSLHLLLLFVFTYSTLHDLKDLQVVHFDLESPTTSICAHFVINNHVLRAAQAPRCCGVQAQLCV